MSAAQIDEYLRGVEEPKREALEALRCTILEILPDAEQCISYRIPAFRVQGKVVAGFAAFTEHLSYLPFSGSVLGRFVSELEGYSMTKSALHFTAERPLPRPLVVTLIETRLEQIGEGFRQMLTWVAGARVMNPSALRDHCLSFPGAEETFPFGANTSVFKVGRKMFALSQLAASELQVSVKCEPALAEQLREAHAEVTPGYHLNKRHWNTILVNQGLPDQMIKDMIEDSYDLVVSSLPASLRRALGWRPAEPSR